MRNTLASALAGATLLAFPAVPALAGEGDGTGRANFYLELARDQARLRERSAPGVIVGRAGPAEAYARSQAAPPRPVRPRR